MNEQAGATLWAPRTTKDLIERALFLRRGDTADIFPFDTTSSSFAGADHETLGRYGKSKDQSPDPEQIVVGLVPDNDGYPIRAKV